MSQSIVSSYGTGDNVGMSTETTTVSPVAKLYREAYNLGVEHHSTCQMPIPLDKFEERYTVDIEFIVPMKELYSIYRKGYRAGAPVKVEPITKADVAALGYVEKLSYVKADPRFKYVSGGGFVFGKVTHTSIDTAYLYTKRFFENGGEEV